MVADVQGARGADLALGTASPVSYTHLDVYKRQGPLNESEIGLCQVSGDVGEVLGGEFTGVHAHATFAPADRAGNRARAIGPIEHLLRAWRRAMTCTASHDGVACIKHFAIRR